MKRNLKLLLLAVVCSYILYSIYLHFSSDTEDGGYSMTAYPEYLNLFANAEKGKIESIITYYSKVNHPVGNFLYDEGKYDIIVYRVDIAEEKSLKEIIKVSEEEVEQTQRRLYRALDQGLYDLYVITNKQPVANEISLMAGKNFVNTYIINDSVAAYNFTTDKFALNYGKDTETLIYAEADRNGKNTFRQVKLPFNVLFFKRNKTLYLLLMVINQKKDSFEPATSDLPLHLLYKLVSKNAE